MIVTGVPRPGDDAKLVEASAAPQMITEDRKASRIPQRRAIDYADD